ncbi:MAG: DUF4405 domain-containing protein [Deltaproteobacteria bacterium]|nr:DUF4405 domain-containing protein [Deltaproteobacteria bacterium]
MTPSADKSFRWAFRSFVSLLTTFSFLGLAITGIVLFIEPHGRVAFWTWWRFLGLSKSQWDGVHIILGWTFIISSGLHIYLNWRPLMRYLRGRVSSGFRLSTELVVAATLTLLLAITAALNVPPTSYLLKLNEAIKSSWMECGANDPPFGHAEMKSLRDLCLIRDIELSKAMATLKDAGIKVGSPSESIATIAKNNGLSPAGVYRYIRALEPADVRRRGRRRGGGLGRRRRR